MKDNRLNEITVNDIIRKINERMDYLAITFNKYEAPPNSVSRYDELKSLLKYIEHDEEY